MLSGEWMCDLEAQNYSATEHRVCDTFISGLWSFFTIWGARTEREENEGLVPGYPPLTRNQPLQRLQKKRDVKREDHTLQNVNN